MWAQYFSNVRVLATRSINQRERPDVRSESHLNAALAKHETYFEMGAAMRGNTRMHSAKRYVSRAAAIFFIIEFSGSSSRCDGRRNELAVCHRHNQSLLNILVYNLQLEMRREGARIVGHDDAEHPKNTRQRHETRRAQTSANLPAELALC